MEEEDKVLTYAELKTFCNQLSEEQLTQTVKIFLSDNDSPSEVNFIEELGEDHYYFPEHEYGCSKRDYDKDIMLDEETDQPLYLTLDEAIEKEEHFVTSGNRVYMHSIDG